jgi:CheY-like chemotaxis protein/nitrogen-specific signal transduction histidine kinase
MGDTARVLMVDDRADNLLALEAVLDPLGAELVRAGSGEEALRALLSVDFAVIILDVQMPGMDGFETAQLIKARDKTRNVPIIFLTAISGEAEHHLEGYRSGAVDYVYKPFSPEALRAKVAVFLELWRQGNLVDRQRAALADQLREVERLNAELERSNAALERLASAAAAEIQQPLDNVAGLLDLLEARHGDDLDEEAGLLMTRAEANVARVRERVATLLEYARVSADGFELEPVRLDDVVDEAAGARAGELGGAGVQVLTSELPEVRGDRAQLVKLFGALLDNAVRHGGVGPLTVQVDAEEGPALVTVTVCNDGNPIPAEVRPRLFTLLPLGGNGAGDSRAPAGLAVARRIVEGHGGAIWCGPADAGASISFTLPAVRR